MFGPVKKPSRLGQWDGRRRSSRSDDPVLPHLCRVPVLSRLGAVLVTALSVTFLAYTWGPPQSYRVGEIYPHDLRARVYFDLVDQAATDRKRDEAVEALPADRRSGPEACERARRGVPAVVDRYPLGALLVQRGHPITEPQRNLVEAETRAFLDSQSSADHFRRGAAL